VAAFDRAIAKVDVLALPTVRSIAPPVEDVPSDPSEAILSSRLGRDHRRRLTEAVRSLPSSLLVLRHVWRRDVAHHEGLPCPTYSMTWDWRPAR
jgi:hypothetical protein